MIFLAFTFEDGSDKFVFALDFLIALFLVIYVAIQFKLRSETDFKSQRETYFGFGTFSLSLALLQIAYFIRQFRIKASLSEIFPQRIAIGGTGFEYVMFIVMGFGFIFLVKPIEIHIQQKEKARIHQFNIITFILVTIPYIGACIHPTLDEDPDYWTLIALVTIVFFALSALISVFGSLYVYFNLGFKSTGVIREKGFYMGFGLLMMLAGLVLTQVETGINIWFDALYGKVMMMVGALMTIRGQQLKL